MYRVPNLSKTILEIDSSMTSMEQRITIIHLEKMGIYGMRELVSYSKSILPTP